MQTRLFIDGEFVDALDGGKIEVLNPFDNSRLAEVEEAREADVDRAVAAAGAAFPAWSRMDAADRGQILLRLADLIEARAEELIELEALDTGHPVRDARKLDEMTGDLQAIYEHPATLISGEREFRITGPIRLVDAVLELGRKGLSVQRYKGLGEMNPDQLWETTLDPNARALLHVKVSQAQQAGNVFSTLMGDVVEPRRDFIQSRALEVVNLDV